MSVVVVIYRSQYPVSTLIGTIIAKNSGFANSLFKHFGTTVVISS